MDSDPVLSKRYQALFDEFNARYFHGRLPPYRILVVEHIPGRGGPSGLHQRTHKRILVRRSDDDDMIVTLLHEMAHAATVDNHNSRWRTKMQRLRQAGAPIPDEELRTLTHITEQEPRQKGGNMATMQDSLTPKRNYLESRIRHHAGSAGLSIDDLSWCRPPDRDVSELTITISGIQKQWTIPHTNDPLGFALFRATNQESDELAKTIVRDLAQ